jgi:hypothetical protein
MDTTTAPADEQDPRCVGCRRELHATEATRWACSGCQQQAATQLAELPSLYAALDEVLIPGRGVPLVGGRGAFGSRPPGDLDVMDLTDGTRGGVIATLVSCVKDWVETEPRLGLPEWPPGEQARVLVLCEWLRFRLDWACGLHRGVEDSLHSIEEVHQHAAVRATGESRPRPMRLTCHCGGVVKFRIGGRRFRCNSCPAEYGYAEATRLPPAKRTVAAA